EPTMRALVAKGYKVSEYIPYGPNWLPYFLRRLRERPRNALTMLRSLVQGGMRGRRLLPGRVRHPLAAVPRRELGGGQGPLRGPRVDRREPEQHGPRDGARDA